MKKIKIYLRLIRPANIVTSVADILAGIAISGFFINEFSVGDKSMHVLFLCLSTIGLYGGGIVFNDIFDAELDKLERPERPIPSAAITVKEAGALGLLLLLMGITAAWFASMVAMLLAFSITCFALLYDKFSKHHLLLGPLNMGICRGLNLLLGISIVPAALQSWYFIAAVPVLYIFSITLISQGEVHGGGLKKLYTASLLYAIVTGSILFISFKNKELLPAMLFIIPFIWMIFSPLIKAIRSPEGKNIGRAVKAGVIGLILMDAAWAAGSHSFFAAVFIAALLPLSVWLGKQFAVT